jgi:hypothetical protein
VVRRLVTERRGSTPVGGNGHAESNSLLSLERVDCQLPSRQCSDKPRRDFTRKYNYLTSTMFLGSDRNKRLVHLEGELSCQAEKGGCHTRWAISPSNKHIRPDRCKFQNTVRNKFS